MGQQTNYISGGKVYCVVNVIGDDGAHIAADPAIGGQVYDELGASLALSAPTVIPIAGQVGVYRVEWALTLDAADEGKQYTAMLTGGVGGVAWTPYGVPLILVAAERGTEGANTVVPDNAGIAANNAAINNLNDFDPTVDEVITDAASRTASKADVSGLSTFDVSTDAVITDAASRTASQADVSTIETELGKVPKKGVEHTYTNVLGGSDNVTITEA